MIRKYASATIISAEIAEEHPLGLVKASHRAVFSYDPRPGFLYVRSRAISSRTNDNHDEFPAEEIRAGWRTFIGKPVFVNHRNEDHRRMRGVIIDAALHEDTLPDGRPDVWVECLHEIDAQRFPKLAQAILAGRVNRTSMGTDVAYSICSACNNRATTPAEYCQHIPQMKGKVLYRHTASGQKEGHLIREKCYGLKFFENSFLVEDPADPTAYVLGTDDRGLKATAASGGRGGSGFQNKPESRMWPKQTEPLSELPQSLNSLHKQAVPEGLRFHFEPSDQDNWGSHTLTAFMPNGAKAGHIRWEAHPESGLVNMIRTDPEYRRQGIASALWRRAHELANERGITPPRHDEQVQTPEGEAWAAGVDEHPVVMRGQQPLFDVPEPYATTVEQPHPRPTGENIAAHLREHHGSNTSWTKDPQALLDWHQGMHGFGSPHRHAVRKQAVSDEEIWKGLDLPTAEDTHQEVVHQKAKDVADSLMKPFYEPYGGEENYRLHQQNEGMQDLHRRYEGGTGTFGFDEEGDPYYEINHKLPNGRHSGWQVRHYSDGPNAEIRHMATPDEAHDLYDIGEDTYGPKGGLGRHVRPPETFGHQHLEKLLNDWHDDQESGSREYLEGRNGDPRIRRFKMRYPQGKPVSKTSRKLAYGEVKAPQDVDTLRTESCPVCGEQDSFDGQRCMVCNFVQPPAIFQDPDTSVAKQMDMQKVPFDQGMVGPNGEPVQGPPGDPTALEGQPMQDVPGQPGDEVADLFCPACGFSADTQEPMTDNDPSMPAQQEGLVEGDVCPNCGQATMLSGNDIGEMGGDIPQELADDANADGIPDDQQPAVEEDLAEQAQQGLLPGQEGVPAGASTKDDASADSDKEIDNIQTGEEDVDSGRSGDQDENEAEGEQEEDEDSDEQPPVGKRRSARKVRQVARGAAPGGPTHMRENMTQPNGAATAEEVAALKRHIAAQDTLLEIAGQQLHYLATLAGVSKEFDAIKRQGAKKIADIMNPAEPVPDPPGTSPTESTDQAATPETFDDPRRPGLTPGSVSGVPAQMTDTPLQPGVTIPTQPFNNLVDVTAPIDGTQSHVPYDQTKIETDVRVGDPMVNADNPQGYGFPLTGPYAQEGAASVGTTSSPGLPVGGSERTMASIRLARLRKNAGLLDGDQDDLMEATRIETNAALSTQMINHEISTLEGLAKAASKATRRPSAMPRQASAQRSAPSLATPVQERPSLSATAILDDDVAELFLD